MCCGQTAFADREGGRRPADGGLFMIGGGAFVDAYLHVLCALGAISVSASSPMHVNPTGANCARTSTHMTHGPTGRQCALSALQWGPAIGLLGVRHTKPKRKRGKRSGVFFVLFSLRGQWVIDDAATNPPLCQHAHAVCQTALNLRPSTQCHIMCSYLDCGLSLKCTRACARA